MRLALISDIHGNLEAFDSVLQDIKRLKLDKIMCCGDIVNYCANPNEVIDLLKENKVICVQGNHDIHAVDMKEMDKFNAFAQKGLRWTNLVLKKESKDFLKNLPKVYRGEIDGRRLIFVHGSLENPWWDYVYPNTNESILKNYLEKSKAHVIVCGHTHLPFIKRVDGRLVVNCGSVGQPRDHNNKASYCVLDTHSLRAHINRVEYDIDSVAKKIISAGLPGYLAERLSVGR